MTKADRDELRRWRMWLEWREASGEGGLELADFTWGEPDEAGEAGA